MDILSHGLWTAALGKGISRKFREPKGKKHINLWAAAFWGVFPDLIAFTPAFVWFFWGIATGKLGLSDLPQHHIEDASSPRVVRVFELTLPLYNLGHSAVVFFVVLFLFWLIRKWFRRRSSDLSNTVAFWELSAWLFHIIADIPLHSSKFYPTPVLWPLSEWRFDGISWAVPWIFFTNVGLLAVVYVFMWRSTRHRRP